jgi:type IV pilus assembly protein PilC
MAVYEYTAKDETGSTFAGTYNDVENVAGLREELTKMGYALVKAHRKKKPARKRKKVKQLEVVTFAYKLAGMYSAGLSIIRCLETLEEQTENQAFKYIIADIRQSIETGSSLGKAFGKYRNVFSDFFLGMLEAGETGGKLATSLEMSAAYLEKQVDLKRKVKSAFAYPLVVGITCLVVVSFLLVFVIPVFSKLYEQLHVPLPGPTQVLVGISTIARDWWWAILIVAVAAVIILQRLSKNPHIRARWDAFKLNMPVFAKLNRMLVVSQFTRTFAMLASVGVSLIKALDVASVVAHNHKVTEITKELQEAIETGNPVAKSLKEHDIFPPIIIQLAASGEEVGRLPEMLNKGVDFLDKDIDRIINALVVKLEPAATVIMGAIVGFILISAYLPMFDYMRHLK